MWSIQKLFKPMEMKYLNVGILYFKSGWNTTCFNPAPFRNVLAMYYKSQNTCTMQQLHHYQGWLVVTPQNIDEICYSQHPLKIKQKTKMISRKSWEKTGFPNSVPYSRHRLAVADPSPQSIYCNSQNCKNYEYKAQSTVQCTVVFTCWKLGPRWVIYSCHIFIYSYSCQNLSLA